MTTDDRPGVTAELSSAKLGMLDRRISTPSYDRAALTRSIVHIGVGGFHRAHQAVYIDDLCRAGAQEWSITGAGVRHDDARMADALAKQDHLYALITRENQDTTVRVVGSIVDYVLAAEDHQPLVDRIADARTRIVSLTITEGGYPVDEAGRAIIGSSREAMPTAFKVLAEAARRRRDAGRDGFTVLSCDNILGNGDTARVASLGVASMVEPGLERWIEQNVSFPNGMVDRITPATSDADRAFLRDAYGLADRWPVVSEPFTQWVIEDEFPFGRPPLEDAGVLIVSDVKPYEVLKLRILNAGHSTLAYLAALVGHVYVHDVMADPPFARFLWRFHDEEVTPSLPPVPGIDVKDYKRVVAERFANHSVGDQVSRLCGDGTSKFPKFLLPTIEAQLDAGGQVKLSALALAGWCHYLLGVTDAGAPIALSDDPRLEHAVSHAMASRSDPAAFLGMTDVLGPRLGADPVFVDAFAAALDSIRRKGTYRTLETWLTEED